MASVTQVFYVTNWLHDWWYDSGFNEAAGNAQKDNFGRGGVAGDPLHAEAQNGAPKERDKSIAEHHVICYRAGDGKQLWDTTVPDGKCRVNNPWHGYATPTPATEELDGRACPDNVVALWIGVRCTS